ncbi:MULTISPECIES: DUF2182 domain-containing protein [unclassified Streptomyces]|uniref:DUF2182 domain-containing protein n=1 Tax=unclassified Streptomyces TaxID=2593676 RepID=UPI0022B717A0|nr:MULTISPECIES: DUF2182 domain-containing protein [unclassified Streptomyces]MCZ7417293.1 DUF2182 domain-containing protein [Streptomyces sp. WMMC897]MCZ7432880.1 DUF2182 domain-containing protein [Streptomyces sp. WMMC1477]
MRGSPERAPGREAASPSGTGVERGPLREYARVWAVLVLLIAVPAWLLTVAQAGGLGAMPGTMGLALPLFLVMWLTMMTAMMFPALAPVALTWGRGIRRQSRGLARAARFTEFTVGYLLAWTALGVPAYGVFTLVADLSADHPGAVRWIGAGAYLVAGVYQFTWAKSACLRHCRSPMGQLLDYSRYRPRLRDLRVGLHHGLYCVGCCWGLMLVLVPLGAMNVAAMAALALVIFLEKLWPHGWYLSRAVGVVFLALAALVPFQSWPIAALS